MKSYPSIVKFPCEFHAHIFDKLDGSNLRFEWSYKRGWYKYGTRNRMFDETDVQFGEAIPLFHQTLADPIAKIAYNNKWGKVVVFAEFWGDGSIAGRHYPDDEKRLTLFDISPHKKGLLPPEDFRRLFEDVVPTPKYLGKYWWNKNFLNCIRNAEIDGITFEGVVGKGMHEGNLVMAKAKTQMWRDEVEALYIREQEQSDSQE